MQYQSSTYIINYNIQYIIYIVQANIFSYISFNMDIILHIMFIFLENISWYNLMNN